MPTNNLVTSSVHIIADNLTGYLLKDKLTHHCRSSNMSGRRKFNRDHSSDRLFCNGVPVSSNRFAALYVFNSLMRKDQPVLIRVNKNNNKIK